MITAIVLLTIASYYDIRYRKIPNTLSLCFGILGLCLSGSFPVLGWKLLGVVAIFFLGMLRIMGMGDLKLWMALCCILGFLDSAYCIGIGAGLLIIHSFLQNPKESFRIFSITAKQFYYLRKIHVMEQKEYPFAPYILAGTIVFAIIRMVIS